jgi:CRP-like cAMP-binding protein
MQAVKGMGFGELALLYDSPRAATVVASSAVQTWAIDRVSFKRVMIGTTIRKVRTMRSRALCASSSFLAPQLVCT